MSFIPTKEVLQALDNHLSKNNYDAAKQHLLDWLTRAEELCDDKGILLLYNELMGLCRKLAQKEQALEYAKLAILQTEKMGIENNVGAATTYLNSATVYKAFSMADTAILLFERAKSIYEANLLPNDDRLAGLYNNMALALVDLKRFEEAFCLYNKAICVLQKAGNNEPQQAITYLNMATAAEAQHGLEAAEKQIADYIDKASELLDCHKNSTDGNYAFVCEKCASVFGYYGYFLYEKELKERCRRIYERN